MISWKKQATAWRGMEGPLVVNVAPAGDGRCPCEIFADESDRPMIGGALGSIGHRPRPRPSFGQPTRCARRPASNALGATKDATVQLVKRSVRV